MNNLIFFRNGSLIVIFLSGLINGVGIPNSAHAQSGLPSDAFYLHSFLSNSVNMTFLADGERSRFGWTTQGLLPSYQSYLITAAIPPQGVIGAAKTKVDPTLVASSLTDLVAVGYSAGGLVSRSETHFNPSIIKGIVTINTPNAGAFLANWLVQDYLIAHATIAIGEIARGPGGIGAQISIDLGVLLLSPLVVGITSVNSVLNGFIADMRPGSTYLNSINNPAGAEQAIEQNLLNKGGKVVEVFGIQSSPKLPAFIDFAQGQAKFRALIQNAKNIANNYQQEADRINSGRHWWQFWKWGAIWAKRWRANDWNISAQGFADLNLAWERSNDALTPSDAFITVNSQLADPACISTDQFRLRSDGNGNTSHGVANQNFNTNFDLIHDAMKRAGAIGL